MGKTILVIDDDIGLIRMIEKGLEEKGYNILSANTAEGGLHIAEAEPVDLILLDVILPGIKGREACARLKANERTKSIPVIFLTAKDSPDDIKAEMEAGAIAHITKPVDMNLLIPKIVEVLDNTDHLV